MEKEIKFVEGAHTQSGTSYWKVEFADGERATCWDKGIADNLEPGKRMDLEIKVSPDGKFKNIRGINVKATATGSLGSTPMSAPSPAIRTQDVAWEAPSTLKIKDVRIEDVRGKSIIAQCLCKAVMGQVDSKEEIEGAVAMYKKAFGLLG